MSDTIEGSSLTDHMALAAAGRGVTIIPESIARSIHIEGTVMLPLDEPSLVVKTFLVSKAQKREKESVANFRKFVEDIAATNKARSSQHLKTG